MNDHIPLFREVRFQAMREKREIVCKVMMADDSIRLVRIGPRGGWSFRD